jgi:hypothetical protein
MRRLAVMSLFQWFGMWGYWTYAVYSLARTIGHTADPHSTAFHSAVLTFGEMATFYNLVACVGAFAMVPVTRRIGAASVHAFALLCGGVGMMTLPFVTTPVGVFAPAFGIGLAWGSIMGNPPTLLGQVVPASRIGVYMGLYNVMIVVPMLLFSIVMGRLDIGSLSLGFGLYRELLGGDPRMMMRLCGACLIAAAMAALWVRGGGAGSALNEGVASQFDGAGNPRIVTQMRRHEIRLEPRIETGMADIAAEPLFRRLSQGFDEAGRLHHSAAEDQPIGHVQQDQIGREIGDIARDERRSAGACASWSRVLPHRLRMAGPLASPSTQSPR